jgi:hypothetical protein
MKVSVSVGNAPTVAAVAARSRVAVGKLEDNIGNLDRGDDGIIATGETLVYNASTEKWEAVSLQDKVDAAVSVSNNIGGAVEASISAGVTLDGGTF